ncbi:MAG TPA: LuxR C-terminal-related transcriptional regulator [Streptosporangiaceae bacterium]|jgi:predicted ATPase/DNA-binding CsgD family transcriptional regulator/Tfp pilus assembly protein PilF
MTTTISPSAGNLPAEPNSFVGRERDLAELGLLLTDVRVLTLCGPGGIGKTRLALRLATQLASGFADGAWLAELADLTDPALVERRVAATLGVRDEPDRPLPDTLAEALRSRELLLVLDTCEHLVDACAPLVQHLLASCRGVRVISTSREPLRVRGETVWRVPPLELPAALEARPADEVLRNEAVRLFADRATAVRPGFALTPRNAAAVAALCRTLDGIPLAIELAAARIRALSVEQVATRLSDRFQLLASGDRTAPMRQQTLRAAVDWSYELLTEPEQVLLSRLSVFSGWSLDMAEQVCSDKQIPAEDVLDLLAALIDKSLVSMDSELTGDARYRLLDTIAEYAAGRLAASGEEADIRAAHCDYLLALAEDTVARAFVRGEPSWPARVAMYRRIGLELPNFRAALAQCLSRNDAEQGLRLCLALRSPWVAAGDLAEGTGWFDRFLALPGPVRPAVRGTALVYRAELAYEQQDYQAAATFAGEGLELLRGGGQPGESSALRVLALIGLRAGRGEESLASVDAAVTAARAAGDCWEEGLALGARAAIVGVLGELEESARTFDAALHTLRDNNGWGVAQTLYGYGTLARRTGDLDGALARFRTALALYRELDARPEMARCLAGIGRVALTQGDLDLAAASLGESLQLSMAAGQRLPISRGLEALARLAVRTGDLPAAARLAGAAATLRVPGPPGVIQPAARQQLDPVLEAARQGLGAAAAGALADEGARLSAHEALALALALHVPRAPGPTAAAEAGAGADGPGTDGPGTDRPGTDGGPAGRAGAGPRPARPPLTARELQIARLIARGLSNRAIAHELTISPATAARHVANIFGKLGFTSRAQVAAWVAERDPGRTLG